MSAGIDGFIPACKEPRYKFASTIQKQIAVRTSVGHPEANVTLDIDIPIAQPYTLLRESDAGHLFSATFPAVLPWAAASRLACEFHRCFARWKRDTVFTSSATQIVVHPDYQRIISMGGEAVPLLLKELQQETCHVFWALKTIAREDPVPREFRGDIVEMRKRWLKWGQQRGII